MRDKFKVDSGMSIFCEMCFIHLGFLILPSQVFNFIFYILSWSFKSVLVSFSPAISLNYELNVLTFGKHQADQQ